MFVLQLIKFLIVLLKNSPWVWSPNWRNGPSAKFFNVTKNNTLKFFYDDFMRITRRPLSLSSEKACQFWMICGLPAAI